MTCRHSFFTTLYRLLLLSCASKQQNTSIQRAGRSNLMSELDEAFNKQREQASRVKSSKTGAGYHRSQLTPIKIKGGALGISGLLIPHRSLDGQQSLSFQHLIKAIRPLAHLFLLKVRFPSKNKWSQLLNHKKMGQARFGGFD